MITAGEITTLTGGRLLGDGESLVDHAAGLETAGTGAISFVASSQYLPYLRSTQATIVLVPEELVDDLPEGSTAVVVDDPHRALRAVLLRLYPEVRPGGGVHSTAIVGAGGSIGEGVHIGAYAIIGDGVEIGARSVVGAHATIGDGCHLGEDVKIHNHVTVYGGVEVGDRAVVHSGARIGNEGFGFVWEDGHRKVPQVGGCIIGNDVELGANVTVDRGSIGNTVIGDGTKIDNLVHIGHNVRIGRNVLIIAQVGISGSTTVGDGAILAGQVGTVGHIKIGAGARIGAQAGVISDVPAGETFSGYPARPHREAMRAHANLFRLAELVDRVRKLEKFIGAGDRVEPNSTE